MKNARLKPLALAMLATTALSGCANMADTPPGTPLDAVTAQFGAPTMTCSQPDGATRAIWSQQPFGQYAWATNVTPEGNVGSVDQVLADKAFEQLSEGVWDPQRVQCAFGPPADIDGVGMPSVWKVVWSYRYKQYDVWNSMMYVFFDPQTNIVVDHYPGPDPMFMFDDVWFM